MIAMVIPHLETLYSIVNKNLTGIKVVSHTVK